MSEIPPYKSPALRSKERKLASYKRMIESLERQIEEIKGRDLPPVEEILRLVALHSDHTLIEITGSSRQRNLADLRCIFIHIAVQVFGHTLQSAATVLDRDHSTVLFSRDSYHGKVFDASFREMAITIEHNVKTGLNRQATSRKTILE